MVPAAAPGTLVDIARIVQIAQWVHSLPEGLMDGLQCEQRRHSLELLSGPRGIHVAICGDSQSTRMDCIRLARLGVES